MLKEMRILIFLLCWMAIAAQADEGVYRISLEGLQYPNALPGLPASEAIGEIEIDKSWRGKAWGFKFHPLLKGNSVSGVWSQQAVAEPKEIYLERRGSRASVRVGAFTPQFEGTDGLNPMDIATMKDSSDVLRTSSRGSAGVWLGFHGQRFEGEVFWVPYQADALIPGARSGWWPRVNQLPLSTSEGELRVPDHVEYQILPSEYRNQANRNNGGFRWQYHGDFGEFALAGFEGAAQWPFLKPIANSQLISINPQILLLESPVQIQPIQYRRRSGSGFFLLTAGEWIFKVAGRHDQVLGEDADAKGWTQQVVGGIERSFTFENHMVTVILQGVQGKQSEIAGLASVSEEYNGAAVAGVRWAGGERSVLLVSGFYNSRKKSHFADVNWSWRWGDRLTSEIFYQSIGGSSESLLGVVGDRDRGGLRLTTIF